MRSVKGMTIGSPEFDAAVRANESEAENTESIAKAAVTIKRILRNGAELTSDQRRNLRRVGRDINEVLGE